MLPVYRIHLIHCLQDITTFYSVKSQVRRYTAYTTNGYCYQRPTSRYYYKQATNGNNSFVEETTGVNGRLRESSISLKARALTWHFLVVDFIVWVWWRLKANSQNMVWIQITIIWFLGCPPSWTLKDALWILRDLWLLEIEVYTLDVEGFLPLDIEGCTLDIKGFFTTGNWGMHTGHKRPFYYWPLRDALGT